MGGVIEFAAMDHQMKICRGGSRKYAQEGDGPLYVEPA